MKRDQNGPSHQPDRVVRLPGVFHLRRGFFAFREFLSWGHLQAMAAIACLVPAGFVVAADQPARGRALLVGCTKYDHLDPSLHLQGPANDVALMRDLLCQRFAFSPERVVTLAESVGPPRFRPTRANIEREFHRLGREAEAGEQIVIFLAGHGSQQPVLNPSPDNPEPDGLDELFLPADVKGWDLGIGQVPNAIVDDELQVWLREIERRQAVVTVIVDSCHSGSMTRGVGERLRQIPPGVLVPLDVLAKVQKQAIPTIVRGRNEQTRGQATELIADSSQVIAIYASQSSEATVEKLLPVEGQDRRPYGLLTYTMNQVLSRSSRPLSYRELVRQVQLQYLGGGRSFPTPMIEGLNRDRELFGMAVWPNRSQIELTKTARGWSINAGVLQGISQDTVLSVFGVDGKDRVMPVGHVRVQLARTIESEVVPCEFEGQPAVKDLPNGGRCEVAFLDAGDLRLRVAVVATNAAVDADWVQRLKAIANPATPTGSRLRLVQFVEKDADADWLVQVRERDIIVFPAESGTSDSHVTPPTAFGPHPRNAATVEWLSSALERIARAANLKKLAASEDSEMPLGDAVHIDLQIERANGLSARDSSERVTLRDGEPMTIRLTNPCRFPVDVTLLSIDTACGIAAVFPGQGEINRLQPGDSVPLSTRVVAKSRGLEHLVAIVVKGDREVVDFTSLAQPSLQMVQTRGGPASTSLNSPFGELLKYAVFAEGKTRGVKRTTVKAHRLQLLTWEVEPNITP